MVKRLTFFVRNSNTFPLHISHSIGMSGATIHDVKSFIKSHPPQWDGNIPLLIFLGTNNVFKNTPLPIMKQQYISLLRIIRRTCPHIQIIITQLPLYPRALQDQSQITKIHQFNKFLHTLSSKNTHFFETQIFLDSARDYQHQYRYNGRTDKIHFNHSGNLKFAKSLSHLLQKGHVSVC